MIRVAEDYLGTGFLELGGRQGLDRALRADRHENGGLDGTMQGLQPAAPGGSGGIGLNQLEMVGHL